MTPDEARSLLLCYDGSVRHGAAAGLTPLEEIALVTKAAGVHDRRIERALGRSSRSLKDALESARAKLETWHRSVAQDTLATVDNRPTVDRATFTDAKSGAEVEIRPTQTADDERIRAHPRLLPTVDTLTAATTLALSVVLDTR